MFCSFSCLSHLFINFSTLCMYIIDAFYGRMSKNQLKWILIWRRVDKIPSVIQHKRTRLIYIQID